MQCANYNEREEGQHYLGLIHLEIQHDAKIKREMDSSDDEAGMEDDSSIGDPNNPDDMRNRIVFFSD